MLRRTAARPRAAGPPAATGPGRCRRRARGPPAWPPRPGRTAAASAPDAPLVAPLHPGRSPSPRSTASHAATYQHLHVIGPLSSSQETPLGGRVEEVHACEIHDHLDPVAGADRGSLVEASDEAVV